MSKNPYRHPSDKDDFNAVFLELDRQLARMVKEMDTLQRDILKDIFNQQSAPRPPQPPQPKKAPQPPAPPDKKKPFYDTDLLWIKKGEEPCGSAEEVQEKIRERKEREKAKHSPSGGSWESC